MTDKQRSPEKTSADPRLAEAAELLEASAAPFDRACALLREVLAFPSKPIDMVLYCPRCGLQHIDRPDPRKNWTNPPHRSHECHKCGHVWRPCDIPTNGVLRVATRGKADKEVLSTSQLQAMYEVCRGVQSLKVRDDMLGQTIDAGLNLTYLQVDTSSWELLVEAIRQLPPLDGSAVDSASEAEPCYRLRDARQQDAYNWAVRTFGDYATKKEERAMRLLEEAMELAQAVGVSEQIGRRILDRVYSRPPGEVRQELGGLGLTLIALAQCLGLSADAEEERELKRVTSLPDGFFETKVADKRKAGIENVANIHSEAKG